MPHWITGLRLLPTTQLHLITEKVERCCSTDNPQMTFEQEITQSYSHKPEVDRDMIDNDVRFELASALVSWRS